MPHPDTELLIEQAVSAWRPVSPGRGFLPHPAWCDLPPADREAAFEATLVARAIESAVDLEGCSGTVRAVMGRMGR